jgi:hypothetical protein
MAYVTGTANSLADLLTAVQNACTGNGWTLSGNVLHKGTCYVELMVSGSLITLRGGTGVDGSNNLTGATDQTTGQLGVALKSIAFTFPMTYEIFIGTSPDEVYVVVHYAVSYYQQIAWGQSAMPGLTGSGNWYCGPQKIGSDYGMTSNGEYGASGNAGVSLFFRHKYVSMAISMGVDHSLDAPTWLTEGAARDFMSIAMRQPNQWNGEAVLHPVRVYASRPSGFFSPVLECAHARFVNMASLADGQIITLGSDRWKVYPWFARGLAYRNLDTNFNVTGTFSGVFGHAFRYDGP